MSKLNFQQPVSILYTFHTSWYSITE